MLPDKLLLCPPGDATATSCLVLFIEFVALDLEVSIPLSSLPR